MTSDSPESQFCGSSRSSLTSVSLFFCLIFFFDFFLFFLDSLLAWSSALVVNRLSQMTSIYPALYNIPRFLNVSFFRGASFMSECISNSMTLDLTLDGFRSITLHSSVLSLQVGY
jgi:hypothetical protein